MKSLNELYKESCKPKCESYKQISNHITLIDNFFEDFDKARDFFINREKWECISYQGNELSGYQSLFPSWIGKSLMEKYVLDNKICDDMNSYNTMCNFLYDEHLTWGTVSHSNYFPHVDGLEYDGTLTQICLINLNKVPVSTDFYTYKNKEHCDSEMYDEWLKYNKKLNLKLRKHYNKGNITRDEIKLFLDNEFLDNKLIKTLEYKPNQAIIYSANLFHSANVTQEFTKDNLRCLLRIMFCRKIIEPEKKFNYS